MRQGLWALFLLFLMSIGEAKASNGDLKDPSLKGLVRELKSAKSELATKDRFRRRLMGSLYSINQRMKKMSETRAELSDQMQGAKAEVSSLARQILVLENDIQKQRSKVARYLKAAHALRGRSTLQALLMAKSIAEFDRTLKFLKLYADRDYKVIRAYKNNVTLLKEKRQKLSAQVENLISLKSKLQSQEGQLVQEQESKVKLLASLRVERKKYLDKMKSLRTRSLESDTFGEDIAELLDISFYEKKGQLEAPVSGNVVQGFGFVQDEEYRFRLSHKGLHFTCKVGSEVRSVFRGTISFADTIPYFGKTVVIDHGDHYYSVYSFLKDIKSKFGEKVNEGDLIGYSGSGSQQFGPGLYFEVRHFSDAIDPADWIKLNAGLQARVFEKGSL